MLFDRPKRLTADAETIHVHGQHRPDVLFELRGLRVVIEGKFADTQNAEKIVLDDARKRVRSGIAHIAVACIYPIKLRSTPTTKILEVLESSQLEYRIIAETHESKDWFSGDPSSLMEALRRAQEALTKDDIVEKTAKALEIQLQGIAQLWIGQRGSCDRLSALLGIIPPKGETDEKAHERRETAAKVSALVLANAFIFQEQLATSDGRISPLRKLEKEPDTIDATAKHWRWIWKNINYVPIFQLGERVLEQLPNDPRSILPVKALLSEAKAICSEQAALRHDLMGRIYHWLLHHAKFLGTYYTSVSAATLLVKLALGLKWDTDFGDPVELASFKTADLACGTGTLLMASAQAFSDLYIKSRAANGRSLEPKDLSTLHRALMENILYGYDVLPSALHLTASTLAMLAPDVAFVKMNLFVMPLGMDHGHARLGSLDFLESRELKTQMSLDYTQTETIRTGASGSAATNAELPQLDLCVMNPPFVRSVYGNLLFGSLPDERDDLQKELSRRTRQLGISATAGLGAVFVSLADMHTKEGGRIAFVLPITLATGEAWSATRKLIADKYHLEIVITSHDAERPNFSENTDLSELLFIARRLKSKEKAGVTAYVNLWRNPRSIHEALDLATRIETVLKNLNGKAGKTAVIRSKAATLGEITCLPAPVSVENWTGALFAQSYLMQVHWALNIKKELRLPESGKSYKLNLCRMDELGTLGYDARDIFDAFAVDKTASQWSPYPGFWDHDAQKVVTIAQKPNAFLLARSEPLPGRKLKSAKAVWEKAGTILLVSRLRTNTHRVIATGFDKRVLGNTWWGFDDSKLSEHERKAILLWLNGTLSILSYFGRRAITEGAWMQMKKPAWASMLVLDVRALNSKQLKTLASAYDTLSQKTLAPIAQLDKDPVRCKIDETFSNVLDLPDIAPIRELLAREPGLTAQDINPRQSQGGFDLDEEEEDEPQPKLLANRKRGKAKL
jgi:hypothetical protein